MSSLDLEQPQRDSILGLWTIEQQRGDAWTALYGFEVRFCATRGRLQESSPLCRYLGWEVVQKRPLVRLSDWDIVSANDSMRARKNSLVRADRA